MADTYAAFDKATSDFTAVALLRDGRPVGRIVIKFGAAATAFVQVWGAEMTSGRATGYGYDKASAAVLNAVAKLSHTVAHDEMANTCLRVIRDAFVTTRTDWRTTLESAGFTLANVM